MMPARFIGMEIWPDRAAEARYAFPIDQIRELARYATVIDTETIFSLEGDRDQTLITFCQMELPRFKSLIVNELIWEDLELETLKALTKLPITKVNMKFEKIKVFNKKQKTIF